MVRKTLFHVESGRRGQTQRGRRREEGSQGGGERGVSVSCINRSNSTVESIMFRTTNVRFCLGGRILFWGTSTFILFETLGAFRAVLLRRSVTFRRRLV